MLDTLLTPFEHEGLWWKPDVPADKIAGKLHYDPFEGCSLSLLGQFGGVTGAIDLDSGSLPVIHGVTKDTGSVTLLDNLSGGYRLTMPGISTQNFCPSYILMGEHIDSLETFVTSQCEFRLTNLEEWLDHRPFNFQLSKGKPSWFDLNVRLPEKQSFSLPHISSTLKAVASYHTSGGSMREFGIKVPSWLIIERTSPQTIQMHLDVISRLRNFIALCLGERVYVSDLVFRGEDEEVAPGKSEKRKIQCCYQQNPSPIATDSKRPIIGITINDLGESKDEIINKWFSLYDDITPSLDILFSVLYTKMYLEVRFLLAVQAVEALHRHLWPANYVDENKYKNIEEKLVHSIPDEVPFDLKRKLKGVLKYGNEFSLRRRLREISKRLTEKEADGIVSFDSAFIDDVVNNRNYLTHYDQSLKANAKTGEALYRLYGKLALTVMVVVFAELGASKQLILEKLQRHRLFGQYVGT